MRALLANANSPDHCRRGTKIHEPALRITGKLQNQHGVIHVKAEKIEALTEAALPAQASHDFR